MTRSCCAVNCTNRQKDSDSDAVSVSESAAVLMDVNIAASGQMFLRA